MKLVRYCVMNFRSVKNSGWIDCGISLGPAMLSMLTWP